MVTSINFGNISTVGGKTVLNGSQSGLDTQGIIKALTDAKGLPAVKLQTSITDNQKKIAAFTDFKKILTDLQTSINGLRNPSGLGTTGNIFNSRNPFVSMTGGKTSSDYLGVTTEEGAAIGKHKIQVTQLAQAEVRQLSDSLGAGISFTSRTTSVVDATGGDASPFSAGTFTLNGINVTLKEGDNLNDVAANINALSTQTGVTANIIKVGDNDFRLNLNGTQTGSTKNITIVDSSNVLKSTTSFAVKQVAKDAKMTLDGETITRSNNTISDVITGVNFNLYQLTGSDEITLDVDKNTQTIAQGIVKFVDAYNAMKTFVAKQQQTDDNGNYLDTAILKNDSGFRTIVDRITSYVAQQASITVPTNIDTGSTTTPTRMGDLGIFFTATDADTTAGTPAVNNVLDVDAAKLTKAIDGNFDAVRKIFEFSSTSSSTDLGVYGRSNSLSEPMAFGITVDTGQVAGQQAKITSIGGNALATPIYLDLTDNGGGKYSLKGQAGTSLSDFSYNYTGDGTDVITTTRSVSTKDMTVTVDTSLADENKASVTSLFGAALTTPIAMKYTAGSGSASIDGNKGTMFEGLNLIYTGDGTDSINLKMSQGIGDLMYNTLDEMIKGVGGLDGLVDGQIKNLQDTNTQFQTSVDRINLQVDDYRTKLLDKYAALEASISSSNQLLQMLDAQAKARANG